MIALVTVTDNNYCLYTQVLLQSLSGLGVKEKMFVIQSGLEAAHREALKKLYSNIEFLEADYEMYKSKGKDLAKFYKFEMFKLRGFEKIVFIDSDILFIKSPQEFFDKGLAEFNFAMIRENHRDCYNSGLIVIDKKYLTDETYMSLVDYPWDEREFGKDQQIFNKKFEGAIQRLPVKYNWFANEMPPDIAEIVGLHYINKNFTEIDSKRIPKFLHEVWFNVYNEAMRRLKCE